MLVVFVTMVCAAVAAPFIVAAWALRRRECAHCGAAIEPDPALVRMFSGN